MSGYKEKHINDLKLGRHIKQIAAVLPLTATLTMGCGEQKNPSSDINSAIFLKDSIEGEDLYGYPVTLKFIKIRTYDTDEIEPTDTYLSRWGTPKEEIPNIYNNEKTYVREIKLDENEFVNIEVFKSKYGIEISKDQPCFMVTKQSQLAYIGNDDSYIKNLEKYARINKTIPQDKEETIIRDDRLHKIIKVPVVVQNSDASIVQATLDSLVHTSDSSAIQNKPDTLEKHNTADTLSLGITIPDSLIHNQEAR